MAFNTAMMGIGGRIIILSALSAEDLAINYNVESQIASQFPNLAPSIAKDIINLTISGDDYIASSRNVYAIDADGLHDEAKFQITLETGCWISGRGGDAGDGGIIPFGTGNPGSAGQAGGTAIRFGCPTTIEGTGTIEQGYGGGGGGGSNDAGDKDGGSGGGGGAPLGAAGAGGAGFSNGGNNGTIATNTAKGLGGASVGAGGFGGNGGENGTAAQAGESVSNSGGSAGSNGAAIASQGFSHSERGGITVVGAIT